MADFSFEIPEFVHVSNEAKELIALMMAKHPRKRIDSEDALHHPWIVKFQSFHYTQGEAQ